MNRSNECHLCNVAHYGDLNRRCDIGLRPSFALLFMSRLGSRPKIGYRITKCLRTQIYSSTSSCILSVATGGAIASCAIAELTNSLFFPSEDPKGMASYLMAPVVADRGCRRPFKARSLSPCVIPRSFSV